MTTPKKLDLFQPMKDLVEDILKKDIPTQIVETNSFQRVSIFLQIMQRTYLNT